MQFYMLALAGLAAAAPQPEITVAPPNPGSTGITPCPSAGITVCEDHLKTCGSPVPTATLTYGGCHDACVAITYSTPSCPTPTNSNKSCTSTGTVCEDHLKTCGSPIPTATLTYGGCHDACDTITYTTPACPTPTTTTTSSCTRTGTVCEDYFKACGSPTPTATLTYGGCHDVCVTPTYTPPPCPEFP
ncbi:hypothetical protein GGS20DRAFT_371862 [Poronia punctata]|nr:hypothetical protein GGS20DRAFT_371862 [Poronia punctata]